MGNLGAYLMTIGIAMVPVLELRGAIPIGVANGLSFQASVICSIIGNMIPIPFILIFIRKIFAWMREKSHWLNGIVVKMEKKAQSKSEVVQKYETLGLIILVAIPLPGTGAWTGALVAAMLDLRLKRAIPAIFAGVLIAAAIVTYITYGATAILG